MANTVQQIRDRTIDYLSEKPGSTTYDFSTVILPKINKIDSQICVGEMKDVVKSSPNNDVIYKAGDLRFLRKQMFIKFVQPTATNVAVNPGDVVINVGSTINFASAGALRILGQVVVYTGKTGTSFTGCTGVIIQALPGMEVRQIFELPANADRTFTLFNVDVRGCEREVPEQDFKFNQVAYKYFKIVGDTNTENKNYLYISGTYSGVNAGLTLNFMLYYYRKSTNLTLVTDVCDLPDNAGIEIIAPLAAGELMMETEMDAQAVKILTLGYANLHAFYSKYTSFNKKFRDKVEYPRVHGNYSYPINRH